MFALADEDISLVFEPDPSGEEMLEKRLLLGEVEAHKLLAGSIPRLGGCIYVSHASYSSSQ